MTLYVVTKLNTLLCVGTEPGGRGGRGGCDVYRSALLKDFSIFGYQTVTITLMVSK